MAAVRTRVMTALAVITLGFPVVAASAAEPPVKEAPADTTSVEEMPALNKGDAIAAQVAALREDWGVSDDEARARIARQAAVGELQERLMSEHPESFGGLWIDHDAGGRPTVATVGLTLDDVRQLSGELADMVSVVAVNRSLKYLEDLQRKVFDAEQRLAPILASRSSSRIDVENNAVVVSLPPREKGDEDPNEMRSALDAIARDEAGALVVEDVDWTASDDVCGVNACDPPLRGGIGINGCTLGFIARENSGALFGMTAEHCGNQTYSHNGKVIGSTARSWNAATTSADAQIISIAEPWKWSPTNWLKTTIEQYPITSTIPTYQIAVGQYVCRTGKVQANKCGAITDTDWASGGLFHLKAATVCSGDGDSGGPWWDPNAGRAYGINKGSTVDGTACPKETAFFSPIRDAETYLDAYVLVRGGDTSKPALRRGNTNIIGVTLETSSPYTSFNFGDPGDIPLFCDWDGDGHRSIGVFRPSTAVFYIRNSNTDGVPDLTVSYGSPYNIPLCGDWDGDGVDSIGVYFSGTFALRNSNSSGAPSYQFAYGNPSGDTPLVGDWNGDGITTAAIWRPNSTIGEFYLRNSHSGGPADVAFAWGNSTDTPVVGDWDGDRDDNIGVARLESTYLGTAYQWYLNRDNAPVAHFYSFIDGSPGDVLRLW